MASNGVTIEAKLDEKGVVTGAKKVTASLEEIKRADGNLNWDGLKNGEKAAKLSGDGFTVLKGVFANLASQGIMMATQALGDFAAQTIITGQTFESSMSKVAALSGATGSDFDDLKSKARELGATTTFSASQAADALGYMALAGWDTDEMLASVGDVLLLAQAGEMDLAAASDLVTDYLSAFNMEAAEAGRMVDVLAYAQANANTTTEGLGMAFKNCAANANAAGMDVETTTAAIAMMANQGLKGSEAGTALNAVMRDMTSRMEEGAIKIGDTSVAVMDAEGNYRDFAEILADVEAATDGMGDAEKAAALQSTFTADSIKGLNLMLNAGSGELVSFRDELYNCEGAAQQTADVMTDNLGGDVAALGSAFEELQLKIYDGLQEPLRTATQFVTNSVIPAVTWMLNNLPVVGTVIAGLTAAILAFKTGVTAAKIATEAWALVTKLQTAAQAALNAVMTANPIGIIILAITALVAAFLYLWNNCEEFRNFWIGVWESVMEAVQPLVDWVMANVIEPLAQGFAQFQADFAVVWDAIVSKLQAAWNVMMPLVQRAFAFIQSVFNTVMPILQTYWGAVWDTISTILSNVWNIMRGIVESVMGVIQGVIQTVTALIRGDWQGVWDGIAQIFQSILQGIFNTAANIFNAISATISSVLSGIYSVWSSIWSSVSGVASSIWSGIQSAISGIINGISANISGVFNGVLSTVTGIWNGIQNAITNPIETARGIVQGAIDTISSIICGARLELPHIKVPDFKIDGGEVPWGIGGKGYPPSVRIDWYAKGGVFDSAQIIGIGEAGREAALPLNHQVYDEIAQGINRQLDGGAIDYERLGAAVAMALVRAGFGTTVINLDGRQIAMAVAGSLDTINGARYSKAVRGLAQ